MKASVSPAPTGRPRAFDRDRALEQALRVFWRKGYDGASLSDLTAAMGINRPSLYAAFGNKEALFRAALERYADGPADYLRTALSQPTARAVAETILRGAADLQTLPGEPPGCLVVRGTLSAGDEGGAAIREEFSIRRATYDVELRLRFAQAVAEGDLPADADPAALALYVTTVVNGMAVQAASGASRAELHAVVETVMQAWPS
jgi:AcrR family transcriptional regulator